MLAVYVALPEPLQAVMAIADDRVGLVLAAVVLHDGNLFFRSMRDKLSFRLFHIVFWRKL